MNRSNRRLRRLRVAQYAAMMGRGEWKDSGDTIRFDTEGWLLDGQHRLHACVDSGVSFKAMVVRSVSPDVMPIIDTGLPRSMADVLDWAGAKNVHTVAAACNLVLQWRTGTLRDRHKAKIAISRDSMKELVVAHPDAWEEAIKLGRAASRSIGLPASVWAALAFEALWVDIEVTSAFFESLVDGVGLDDTSPILALRNWSMNSVATHRRRKQHEVLTAGAKMWNSYVNGRPVKLVKVLPGEETPRLESP